ncbi:cardiolipin synthase [Siphonobacter sp. SORGH_AS_0500]|uniref:cardiolipin synthase n=1 Tax=Siphonobacter sp. SORGH_AS_0500 TaxID=1864824 RepID=UPI000CC94B44|nr:cardiolipin synthase [Siphonobacter sp. SORGH_AS_0500]MDR6195022.1 cardiolipin synthase [Siphonobacter sp. SORGH_AS_0500]PKK38439.1 cardiolipin synthase [Siphonobacter sp. SORGH_AS_0500]
MHFLEEIDWLLIWEVVYGFIVFLVCVRIIYDTRASTKTLAYLLLTVFLPVAGIFIYLSFGINYRKRSLYSKKLIDNDQLLKQLHTQVTQITENNLKADAPAVQQNRELAYLLLNDNLSPLTSRNQVKLLLNGEEAFPEIIKALKNAKHHIHIEYYIYENDAIGNEIKDILIQKAQEGVQVRFIYDDFGSRSIRRSIAPELRKAGVEAYPFYEVIFIALANRLNYRNHRKIIVIDGCTSFTGGINISDRYRNPNNNDLYWRDTHIRIDGPGSYYLQYIFMCDWNFCAQDTLEPSRHYYCEPDAFPADALVQIAASGPDSVQPTILFALLQVINLSRKEILITTPYFIPGDSLQDALIVAALSGIKVKLLVPGISDSWIVNTAASSYYDDLLRVGVEIYRYQKGFIHAKTIVSDGQLSAVGTANMDHRSFELNFEVNAFIYDADFSEKLRKAFYEDLQHAERIDPQQWINRPKWKRMLEKLTRMISPLL